MEFWGVEVKPGKPLKVETEEDALVHISQASLGDCKGKKEEFVPLYVTVDNQKLVLGTLSTENIPHLSCDLVFEKDFELSHNWGKGSVYFTGYTTPNIDAHEEGEGFSDSEDEEVEEVPATIAANGNAAKPKAKPAEVKADDDEEDDSDSEEGMDGSDDEDDSEEEETPTPKKPISSKKRPNEAAPKTPVSAKKAKAAVTPQKTEEKKKGGPATPHPAKNGGKTPKSASQVSCDSCKKTFNSGNALEAHNKAKHSAAK